ncbi:MAG: HlyD family efflux transporter periplasmic adaptor subunit [Nitriliruptorales bacterium]|nr:HlyD family efflux transporter periplasmic adaptor subunit [Nitriliruptorales bacterium]
MVRRSFCVRASLLFLAFTLLVSACFGDDHPIVGVEPVVSGEVVATVAAPARVDAAARQDVGAAVSGVVVALEAADGDTVAGGQTIVRLESTQVELAQRQAAAAQAAAAEVGGITIEGGSHATVNAAQQVVDDLDASSRPMIDDARERLKEIEDPQQRAAAEAAVAAVESTYLNTRAALLASAHALAEQQAAVTSSLSAALNQAVEQATAGQRAQAQAAAAAATQQAEGLSVAAAFDGIISLGDAAPTDGGAGALADQMARSGAASLDIQGLSGVLPGLAGAEGGGTLRVGAPVTAGQTLFTVYDLSQRYVNAEVDEIDAPQITAGQRAEVFIDAFPEEVFEGVVESVAVEAVSTETGGIGYPVRVRLVGVAGDAASTPEDDAEALLDEPLVGQTASVEIVTDVVASNLIVASRALLRRDGGTIIYALRDGRAAPVEVQVGTIGEDGAAVSGDLEVGEQVIVTGYEDLENGTEVRTR